MKTCAAEIVVHKEVCEVEREGVTLAHLCPSAPVQQIRARSRKFVHVTAWSMCLSELLCAAETFDQVTPH